jgi:hypothetical protein
MHALHAQKAMQLELRRARNMVQPINDIVIGMPAQLDEIAAWCCNLCADVWP